MIVGTRERLGCMFPLSPVAVNRPARPTPRPFPDCRAPHVPGQATDCSASSDSMPSFPLPRSGVTMTPCTEATRPACPAPGNDSYIAANALLLPPVELSAMTPPSGKIHREKTAARPARHLPSCGAKRFRRPRLSPPLSPPRFAAHALHCRAFGAAAVRRAPRTCRPQPFLLDRRIRSAEATLFGGCSPPKTFRHRPKSPKTEDVRNRPILSISAEAHQNTTTPFRRKSPAESAPARPARADFPPAQE